MKILQFDSIKQVPETLWEPLSQGKSLAFSRRFWETIEDAKLNDFEYRHIVLVDRNEQPLLITSFYTITTDIAIFASAALRSLLTGIRRFFPGFLKWRMLEWGTPITVSSPPFLAAEGIDLAQALSVVTQSLIRSAQEKKCLIIVARDFEENALHELSILQAQGFNVEYSLPNTYLDIRWTHIEAYHASLKSYYRSKLFKHLRKNLEHSISHQRVSAFGNLSKELCAQWLTVYHQADEFQREILTPDFYAKYAENLGENSQALLFYRAKTLVGHALLMRDGNTLRWLYFGRNSATNDSLYLYVAHAAIEAAIEMGASRLEMGLTTYPIKLDLGAKPATIRIALKANSWLIAPFLKWGYGFMNKPAAVAERKVFKVNPAAPTAPHAHRAKH